MVSNGLYWSLVVAVGLYWSTMVSAGLCWSLLVSNGLHQSLLVSGAWYRSACMVFLSPIDVNTALSSLNIKWICGREVRSIISL